MGLQMDEVVLKHLIHPEYDLILQKYTGQAVVINPINFPVSLLNSQPNEPSHNLSYTKGEDMQFHVF